jgi:hypothetical protein
VLKFRWHIKEMCSERKDGEEDEEDRKAV